MKLFDAKIAKGHQQKQGDMKKRKSVLGNYKDKKGTQRNANSFENEKKVWNYEN